MKKLMMSSMILVGCVLGWIVTGSGEQPPAPRGELRIVDKKPQNWMFVTFNVFEHLMEDDRDGNLVPRLATPWPDAVSEWSPRFVGTAVTDQHWSVRKQKVRVQERVVDQPR